MTKVGVIKFILCLVIAFSAKAQKVKYKDIFGLLSTKQYDQAEPFLKKYVIDTDDNPNAYLYLGIIYQEKSAKNDILKQTSLALKNMDSAIFFFDKANKIMDEKEIRKNKEYYQAYNRRDLRTGEFGVKLSDVQFDMEKRVEGLRERIDRIKMVKYYFSFSDSLYKKSNALYKSIQSSYTDQRVFYLKANDTSIAELTTLASRFDSTMKFFENYRASLQNMGNAGYNQMVSLVEIADFTKDGISVADFYDENLKLWDYKKWAVNAKSVLEKEIIPMRDHLISYDMELNKLREKLSNDSVSVRSDLTKLIDKLLYSQIKKFDENPLPMHVFAMKIADLEYKSTVIEHKPFRDSLNVHLQLRLANEKKKYITKLDSATTLLMNMDVDAEAEKYEHFISSTYNNTVILKSYIKAVQEYAVREIKKIDQRISVCQEELNWIHLESDSIPVTLEKKSSKFTPLVIEEEKYTMGLFHADTTSINGYFYSITPSRAPDIKVRFPLTKENFKIKTASSIHGVTYNSNDQIYYVLIYSDIKVKEKTPATIAKIYRSDGLAWSNVYQLSFIPDKLEYKQDTGELLVNSAEGQSSLIDKNGKLIK